MSEERVEARIIAENLGILLVGHGTRDAMGEAEFLATCRRVADELPGAIVESCFLEICAPPISVGVSRLAEQGVGQLVVMPLLLFAAGHAKRDVPQAVAAALRQFPHIEWRQAEHLGCHPEILAQSAERFREAISGLHEVPREQTALLFVGRGSLDAEAIAETHRFAELTKQSAEVASFEVCFYAMTEPTLDETIEKLGRAGFARVVAQPHLLFDGLILANLQERVAAAAARFPQTQWIVAHRLGSTPRVAQAILDQIASAASGFCVTAKSLSATD